MNLQGKQAVPSLGWQNHHAGAHALIASDRQGEGEKSDPIFSAAVVLTWHANLYLLSDFPFRSLNNLLIHLEKMMMILKLTGASTEIYRLLLLFLLPALLYHTLSLHLILFLIPRYELRATGVSQTNCFPEGVLTAVIPRFCFYKLMHPDLGIWHL